ncbi:MAG: Uma2 family endonuclease [Kamptonema sp. SIO4C4]|nr:Uma2 family endonuclease [Kamptonema sp. SIO4C4]
MSLLTKKFTVDQYHKMGEVGIFDPDERVELLEGEIIKMSPIGLQHAVTINRLTNFFPRQLGDNAIVSIQNPIRLNNHSEPQPDITLLQPRDDYYANKFPSSEDILLLIEVADSSLLTDQEIKLPLYAEHNIIEYWIVNLTRQIVEIYRDPQNRAYQQQQMLLENQSISPLAFPELTVNFATIFG